MTGQSSEEIVLEPALPNLGERLQAARQAKKYTVAEVAAQLRLTKDIVEQLENQQWEKLHGRTYARGYFSSYVKFLGLPHDEMLALFNLEYTITEPVLTLTHPGRQMQGKKFPWLAVSIVVSLIVVLVLAYLQWQKTQQPLPTETGQSNPFIEDAFSNSVVEPLDSAAIEAMQLDADTTDESLEELPLPDAIDESETETVAVETVNLAEAAESGEMGTPAETVFVADSVHTAAKALLQVQFSTECWVEIRNNESDVLLSKMMQANEKLEFSSDIPLNLLLGNASAAVVTFNNEKVDLAPYIRGDVARVTLGTNS